MPVLQIARWVVRDLEKGQDLHRLHCREAVPVDLKVLGVLRILGRATCFDGKVSCWPQTRVMADVDTSALSLVLLRQVLFLFRVVLIEQGSGKFDPVNKNEFFRLKISACS